MSNKWKFEHSSKNCVDLSYFCKAKSFLILSKLFRRNRKPNIAFIWQFSVDIRQLRFGSDKLPIFKFKIILFRNTWPRSNSVLQLSKCYFTFISQINVTSPRLKIILTTKRIGRWTNDKSAAKILRQELNSLHQNVQHQNFIAYKV